MKVICAIVYMFFLALAYSGKCKFWNLCVFSFQSFDFNTVCTENHEHLNKIDLIWFGRYDLFKF